jgi:hypothetical protein
MCVYVYYTSVVVTAVSVETGIMRVLSTLVLAPGDPLRSCRGSFSYGLPLYTLRTSVRVNSVLWRLLLSVPVRGTPTSSLLTSPSV